ncbi:ankyrin repeat-containing protein [Fusarium pseudoanthophilum]|uniref:Ankyrin repeat-containing protein n=1 Tax=Fusarium pseudoanthophilum TaxID=48495 RepID=A0A8H5NQA5_9HYPO|nr:ankyrin repeat-containing protein [Fusarium pseudoanthophilum]
MADPLSVAGLALAVASLGLQVTGGITDYFDSLKSRDQDIASIIQQNDTLRKTLQIIESSISRFQNDHGTATETLRQFLDSSIEELKALEAMVATLNIDDQGTASRRNKARNKGKQLLCPFHRPKVEQMAAKLHHINATLQLGLQSLGLSVSQLGSEKLASIQATSQTISSDLLVVQSEVSSISTPIRGMQTTMSQFETRFNGLENLLGQLLVQGSAINGTLQGMTPEIVTGRLLRKPAVLQEMCDAVETRAQHNPRRNIPATSENATQIEKTVKRYTGAKKASPRAVDKHNQSLVHYMADRIREVYDYDSSQSQADYWQSSPLLNLLQYLLINEAPANKYNTNGVADCAVPISSNLSQVLNNASKRCKLRYVRHMKDRRDRLKQLGLDNLSRVDIERLALESKHILDYNAFEVTRLLEEDNFRIPSSLAISDWNSGPVSVYGKLESPEDAEIFFRSGFGDTGAWCDTEIMEQKRILGLRWLPYLRWLVNHGGISNQLPLSSSKDIFGCHCIFWAIGYHIRKSWKRTGVLIYPSTESESSSSLLTPCVLEDEISWFHEVHNAVFTASVEDTCSCECSIGGHTMLRLLLKGLVDDCRYHLEPRRYHTGSSEGRASSGQESLEGYDTREKSLLKLIDDFITYLEHFYCHLRPRHHYATLRYITHTALGIHHSCYIDKDSCRACEGLFYPVKDGFEYDESHKLGLLEDLLEEFNGSITSILEDPEQGLRDLIYFWERTWVRRMVEVLNILEGDDLPEDERRRAEEIGVMWDNVAMD